MLVNLKDAKVQERRERLGLGGEHYQKLSIGAEVPRSRDMGETNEQTKLHIHTALGNELSLKVGDGANRKGGISWGCFTPPLLHRRSDMPCPTITFPS
jgi:hypothetical protein